MIDLTDLYKIYRMGDTDVNALDGINLFIKAGEFVAIVGPSGSGKSTMMNIIGCLDAPSRGSYKLDGIEVGDHEPDDLARIRNQKIGFIFQGFNLLPKLTAIENVELPLIYMGLSASERSERASQALERVGLEQRLRHKPSELSGGQQQRVAIARALVSAPPVILADEPTGNLDSKSGKDVMQLLHDLHDQGSTIVLITHDSEIAKQAVRRVHISDGRITRDESGEDGVSDEDADDLAGQHAALLHAALEVSA